MSTARRTTRTRGTSGTRGARATGPSAPGPVTLRDQLLEMFMLLEAPFAFTGDDHCSKLIEARAPLLAAALDDAANKNSRLRSWLERAVEGGSLLTVVICAASIAVPVVTHHLPMFEESVDPFAAFLPRSPEEAAARQAMYDQMQAAAAAAAAQANGGSEADGGGE